MWKTWKLTDVDFPAESLSLSFWEWPVGGSGGNKGGLDLLGELRGV